MIQLKNISKSFNDKLVFKNINLSIEKGQFVIFSGASGNGKTTLLNIISSLEKPDSGEVLIENKTINRNIFKYHITYIFQSFLLLEDKTLIQNLKIAQKFNKYDSKEEKYKEIYNVLNMVGLNNYGKQKVYSLSGGQQQRLAIARAVIKNNNIILADEPTGSLDSENEFMVMQLLKKLHDSGKTIIMVTHNKNLFKYADRIIEIWYTNSYVIFII